METTGYYIDFKTFSLTQLKKQLKTIIMIPSHQILKEKIDERFVCLEHLGIDNLEQLQQLLKSKSHVQSFAKKSGIPVDYLTILRREVNSYQPKPINFKDFPGINPDTIQKLKTMGIKNTQQLFPYVITRDNRIKMADQLDMTYDEILELTKLTDMARLKWVGPKFARLLVESKYDTVTKIANSNLQEFIQVLNDTNEKTKIYKGNVGNEDLKLWVKYAVPQVPQIIQFEI